MEINGNLVPLKLMKLIEDGSWGELPEKKDYLERIYKGPVNSLKTLELYDLGVMKFETEGLTKNCSPSYEHFDTFKMFLGKPDNQHSPGNIDFSKSIVIGDLGVGSDAPVALDYRDDKDNPSVVILHYWFGSDGEVRTRWLKITNTFDEFWDAIMTSRR